MNLKRNMHHDITHWPVTGSDGFGGFVFGSPVLYKGRWEDKVEIFLDTNGEEVVSQAIVYMADDTDVGDWIVLGDQVTIPIADPTTLEDPPAFRIRQRNRTTDLRNMSALRKVFL